MDYVEKQLYGTYASKSDFAELRKICNDVDFSSKAGVVDSYIN
jgi:hypothetical protein